MYVDIPDMRHMDENRRAEETERAMKELVTKINRQFETIEKKLAELQKTIDKMRG